MRRDDESFIFPCSSSSNCGIEIGRKLNAFNYKFKVYTFITYLPTSTGGYHYPVQQIVVFGGLDTKECAYVSM